MSAPEGLPLLLLNLFILQLFVCRCQRNRFCESKCYCSSLPTLVNRRFLQANAAQKDVAGQHALPVRKYLDSTVVPVLLQGMNKLSAER